MVIVGDWHEIVVHQAVLSVTYLSVWHFTVFNLEGQVILFAFSDRLRGALTRMTFTELVFGTALTIFLISAAFLARLVVG